MITTDSENGPEPSMLDGTLLDGVMGMEWKRMRSRVLWVAVRMECIILVL